MFSKYTIIPTCNITIHDTSLEQVNSFTCLGSMFTSDGRCVQDVRQRIGIAKSAFISLEKILKSRYIKLQLRIRVLKCYVWSTLLYRLETWTLTSDLMKQLEATEMWFLRRMLRISYKDMVTNEEVIRRANVDGTLMKDIVKRQIELFGHVNRMEELEHLVVTGFIEGKRARGRQRERDTSDLSAKYEGNDLHRCVCGVPQGSVLGPLKLCLYLLPLGTILNVMILAIIYNMLMTLNSISRLSVIILWHHCLN